MPVLRRPRALLALACLGAAAGRLGGEAARLADHGSCRARLRAGDVVLTVRARDPVGDGGRGEVRLPAASCSGGLPAHWPAGHRTAAGEEWVVRGRWVSRAGALGRPGGTLVVRQAARSAGAPPSVPERLRTATARAASSLYGPRAALVHALVLGRGQVDARVRDEFARAGLAHLLSISGFHVGLLAGWAGILLVICGVPRQRAWMAAAACAVGYAAFLGWPAPATRAALLTALLAMERQRQRRIRPGNLLAVTAFLVCLVDPWAIASAGAWMSFAAVGGLVAATRWTGRRLGGGAALQALATSVGATVFTAPVTAYAFGSVAAAGIVLNLMAVPLTAVVLPGIVASLACAEVAPGLAGAFASAAGLGLGVLERLAGWGAALPFGNLAGAGGVGAALPWLGLAIAVGWGIRQNLTARESARRGAWVAAALLWLPLLPRPAAYGGSDLALHFLDVGQGDAIAVRTPGGRWILVDAGPANWRSDAGRRVVVPWLRRAGTRRLALAVVTHAHADHLGGAGTVLDALDPPVLLEPGAMVGDPLYLDFLAAVGDAGRRWVPARAGQRFEVDGLRLAVLHPDPGWPGWGLDVNEDSVVLLLEYGCFRAVLPGDAGLPAEARLRGRVGPVALLKVGHHGSRTATGDAWLDELRPVAAVLSVGSGNRYGHPAPATLARLAGRGVGVWRTDRDGTISARTDGRTLTIRAGRGSRTFATRLTCSAAPPSPPSSGSSSTRSGATPRPPAR
ncbi:MAG TPA: DNA internalization-related competence protein ComEC/Rec2 [Gemmatimonadales bacterium]|nr:DNA internalization-related competence protein ComEC/Rec2 [Gemmatimonadales bacterium]